MTGDHDEYTSGYGVKALSYSDLHAITLSDLMAVFDDYREFADDFLRQFVVTFNIQREVRSVYMKPSNYHIGLSNELQRTATGTSDQKTNFASLFAQWCSYNLQVLYAYVVYVKVLNLVGFDA